MPKPSNAKTDPTIKFLTSIVRSTAVLFFLQATYLGEVEKQEEQRG